MTMEEKTNSLIEAMQHVFDSHNMKVEITKENFDSCIVDCIDDMEYFRLGLE